jgi:hypothetical protein
VNPQLQVAIESVYDAFKEVSKPAKIDGCPCCIDDKEVGTLLSKPLRKLLPDDLSSYASSVFLTVGSKEDFLYFFPRIIEILATDPSWWPSPEIVTRAMHTAGFHSWDHSRKQSVLAYFQEVIEDSLNCEAVGDVDCWICALGRLHADLSSYLQQITLHKPRLLEFYEVNRSELSCNKLANGFWKDAPEEEKIVVEWFRSAEVLEVLVTKYGLHEI